MAHFQEVLRAHRSNPPLDEMCYLICQLGGYEVDIEQHQLALDFASEQLPPTFEGVVSSLFRHGGALRGNTDDYYDVRNSMLSEVQRTRLGIPITLSVLALEHARRARVPMVGIGLPGHFIVGSGDDPDLFADPFHAGRLLDRDGVRELFAKVSGQPDRWRDSFLTPVSSRDIVFRILNNIKVACGRNVADREKLPWVLQLMSWFPQGAPFDPGAARRAMAPFN
jgi:regulator of sirC expression with transglutaminase-like and TPR domain